MEQLKKGLESGTVLIQFEVRDPRGLGRLLMAAGSPESSPGSRTHRGTPEGLRASGRKPGRGGWGHGPSLNSASPSCSSNDQ